VQELVPTGIGRAPYLFPPLRPGVILSVREGVPENQNTEKEGGLVMMKKSVMWFVAGILVLSVTYARAEDRATVKETEAMVKKAVAHYKKAGEKAYVDFTAPSKAYVSKDLYIVAYDMEGKCVAHGQNAKQVGKGLINLKDPDGKAFVKERVELAKSKGTFWQDYKFTDPLTKKVLPKRAYCENADGKIIICGGIYKDK
jgi:signal transduction histidine kinase